jgi:hypothetical protein
LIFIPYALTRPGSRENSPPASSRESVAASPAARPRWPSPRTGIRGSSLASASRPVPCPRRRRSRARARREPVQCRGRGFLDGNAVVDIHVSSAVAPAARVQRRERQRGFDRSGQDDGDAHSIGGLDLGAQRFEIADAGVLGRAIAGAQGNAELSRDRADDGNSSGRGSIPRTGEIWSGVTSTPPRPR